MIYLVQIIGETRHGRHIIRQLMSCFQLEGREKVNLAAAEMCPAGQLGSDKSTIKWFIVAGGGKPLLNCLEDCLKPIMVRKAVRLLCPLF